MSALTSLRCPNCGATVRANQMVCEYCGSTLLVAQPTELALPAIAQAQQLAAQMRERLALNPYDGDAYYQLGLATFTLGRYEQAENAFDQAQRYLPGNAVALYFKGLAMLYGKQDDILGLGEFPVQAIRRQFEMALESDPNLQSVGAYLDFLEGLKLRNHEDYSAAIVPLQRAAAALPALAIVRKVLAACYFQANDLPAAIRAAGQAFEQRPTDIDLAWLLGVAHARLGHANDMEHYARRIAVLRGDAKRWPQVVREFNGHFE